MLVRLSLPPCPWRVGRLALLLIACALALAACGVPPSGVRPVLASNTQTSTALASAYAHDLAWLRQSVGASLDAHRVILLGQTHRSLITDGLITPVGHDLETLHEQLDAAQEGAASTNPLLAEVLRGTLTRAQAERFLNDYAVAASMSPEQSRAIRHGMLGTLAPLREHDESARRILEAFDEHAAHIAELLNELNANNEALIEAFDSPTQTASPIRQPALWLPILEHIEDPQLRAAAEQLLNNTLSQTPATP